MDHISALLQRPGVQVLDIYEFRTSKMCHECQHADCIMHKAKLRKRLKEKVLKELAKELGEEPEMEKAVGCYKVLHCNRCKVFMQRDVNASLNILRLTRCKLDGLARPTYLSRDAPFRDTGGTTENPDQAE